MGRFVTALLIAALGLTALVSSAPQPPPPCTGLIVSYTQVGTGIFPDYDCTRPPQPTPPIPGVDVPLWATVRY